MSLPARMILHVVAACAGTYMVFAPTIDSGFADIQTDPGDTALNHYLLEHTWRWAADPTYRHPLWSPPIYHPQPTLLAYSENLFGVVPLFWALRLGLPSAAAFQVWMILLTVLNYVAMALVLRRLPVRHGENLPELMVALGGFLWAFGLPQHAVVDHPQLLARFWMPPAVYFAWRFAAAPSARWLRLLLLADFLQVVTCINSGWLLTLGLGIYLPVGAWLNGTGPEVREFLRRRRPAVVGAVAVWMGALMALMTPYLIANHGQSRSYGECVQFLPTFSALLAGPPGSWWYKTLLHVRDYVGSETFFFSGFGFLALLAVTARVVRTTRADVKVQAARRFALAGLIVAAALFLVTVNFYGEDGSLWRVLRYLPGGQAIRAVGRVAIIVHLFLIPAVLVGFTVWVHDRWPAGRVRGAVAVLATAVVVFEQTGYRTNTYRRDEVYGKAERLAARVAGADAFYLVPAADENPIYPSVLAMWAGLYADVPTVNGYSGRRPTGYVESERLSDHDVMEWLGPTFRGTVRIAEPNGEGWDVREYVVP